MAGYSYLIYQSLYAEVLNFNKKIQKTLSLANRINNFLIEYTPLDISNFIKFIKEII